jgi:crotonobetainyl-CoA:carnitine CoA-transferase CaiB-like acyl-CoA transferase
VFEDIVVLELSQVFAGPLAARLLAEQGATVIKVERPDGDVSRQLPWRVNGRSGYFVQQNRGKLGVSIDLKSAGGVDALWSLIRRADVLLDGFGPGVLSRFGFDYAALSEANPRLVVCEMSALGRGGGLGDIRGYDAVGAAYSGVAYTAGSRDGGVPVMPSVALGDSMMGMSAYGGIVSALYERRDSGLGQRVEVSLVDSYIQSHSNNIEAYSLSGGLIDSRHVDGQNATVCPSGVFRAGDQKFMYIVALSNQEWKRICACMGLEKWADDPATSTNEARVANRAMVLRLMQAWLNSCESRDVAVERLRAAGVPTAPVLDIGEVIDEPHLRQRGTVEMIVDEVLGEFAVPGPPFRLSRTVRSVLGPAPDLGGNNHEVLAQYGQLTDEQIQGLVASGALVDTDPNSFDAGQPVPGSTE